MTYAEAKSYLYSLERRGVRLGLDRILGAFHELGDPQESFDSVLIAGTNGKGSTAAFTASCLQAAGSRTGLFTSPHLIDFRERIRIDGRMISEDAVVDLTERIRLTVERWQLSFFEATTLIAFLWFSESGVDVAAVEVGLGGRLDATRPVRPLADVVTSISLDHEKILGSSRPAIAGEKAGIFRAGVPTVVGVSAADAIAVLRERSREVGAPFYERRRFLRVTGIMSTADGTGCRFHAGPRFRGRGAALPGIGDGITLEIPLAGRHQAANAALALLALSMLPPCLGIDSDSLRAGFRRARWPGRCEILCERPRIICDVGHNPGGARSLSRVLAARGERKVRLVVGMVEAKDHAGFLRALADRAAHVHACSPRTDRATPGTEITRIAGDLGIPATLHEHPSDAVQAALAAGADGLPIVITGSFYTVGEAMEHLGLNLPDPLWS